MESVSKTIGGNILKYRKARGMTREQLAEALNLDTAYLGQCERGERQLGLSKTLEAVDYFGVTPNDIFPCRPQKKQTYQEEYLREITGLLSDCTDNQLRTVLLCLNTLLPFLKD